jgi:hypothetical protein
MVVLRWCGKQKVDAKADDFVVEDFAPVNNNSFR